MEKRCLDCDWRAPVEDGYTETERSKMAIDHHVETGHTVEAADRPEDVRRAVPFDARSRVTTDRGAIGTDLRR